MKLNTIVKVGDRIGTICYNQLDGRGGVWGRRKFAEGDDLPHPEFMLREKSVEPLLREQWSEHPQNNHRRDLECVGEDFEVIARPK